MVSLQLETSLKTIYLSITKLGKGVLTFKYGSKSEDIKDGVYTIVNTAVIDTWYRPDITADCQIYLCDNEQIYDIVSDPEDIDFRHQYLQFKVQKIGGKA